MMLAGRGLRHIYLTTHALTQRLFFLSVQALFSSFYNIYNDDCKVLRVGRLWRSLYDSRCLAERQPSSSKSGSIGGR
jgi:hypothetical protein